MEEKDIVSVLRNKKIKVRFVPRETSITNPKHVLYGGMAENSVQYYTVPVLASTGSYKNVLTNNEKAFLEEYMGLEYNSLSVHKSQNNFWSNFKVRLTKQDTILDLSDPNDYIKYKVLLANTDYIAPSLQELQDRPRATYQFVLIEDGDIEKRESESISLIMKCYKEYGKIENDADMLRTIVELLDRRPLTANTKLEFLQGKINSLIQSNTKEFYETITDSLLSVKVLIKKAVEAGLITKRGDYYYLKSDGSPLCNNNENPTFTVAARYLALPKNQELKLSIEAKIK